MAYTEDDLRQFQQNEIQIDESFKFECAMCGNCCRNRKDPILVTGLDIFRIAQALGTTTEKVIAEKLEGYLGDTSHLPVFVLKERLDGSCSLLRQGRCTVHKNKPIVCAMHPLGRMYNVQEGSFHYFVSPGRCKGRADSERTWTLQEWLDEFGIRDLDKESLAWNDLLTAISLITCKINKENISEPMFGLMMNCMYLNYDTSKPYIEEVNRNKEMLKLAAPIIFKTKIEFS